MDLEIIRVLKIAGRFDLARAAKELNERTPDDPNATSMDIDGLEKAVAAIALLFHRLGSWDEVRAVVDAAAGVKILPPTPSSSAAIDPALKKKLDRMVDDLEMSTRLASCLGRAGLIKGYLGDLVQLTERALIKLHIKGFGPKTRRELKDLLAVEGLSLDMKVQGWTRPDTTTP